MNATTTTESPISILHAVVFGAALAAANSATIGLARASEHFARAAEEAQKVNHVLQALLSEYRLSLSYSAYGDGPYSTLPKAIADLFPPDLYQELLQGLQVIKSLEPGWNGFDAQSANPEAVRAAELVVPSLPNNLANPRVGIAEEGAVYFKLFRGSTRFTLIIETRKLHLLVGTATGRYFHIDDVAFDGSRIPTEIVDALVSREYA